MTIISNGVPVYASSAAGGDPASNANTAYVQGSSNTAYDINNLHSWISNAVPSGGTPQWIAYDLSGVASGSRGKVDVIWYTLAGAFETGIGSGGTMTGVPSNYTLQGNTAAGGGSAPSSGWVTLATVSSNVLRVRESVVDLTGYNWVRLNITGTILSDAVQLIHFDVYDLSASGGAPQDSFAFYGDSLTLGATQYADVYFGSPDNWTIPGQIASDLSTHYPAETDGGIVGAGTQDGINNIGAWLTAFPGKYVDISYGTNDSAGSESNATFKTHYASLISSVEGASKIAIVPEVPWTGGSYNPGASASDRTLGNIYGYNQQLVALEAADSTIITGPDFYDFFFDNQALLTNDPHPGSAGYGDMRTMWACQLLIKVYGQPSATVKALSMCSPFASYIG